MTEPAIIVPEPDIPWADQPIWKGIDTGPGWYPLITQLVKDLTDIYPDFKVVQVKEKFGGLRFYTEHFEDIDKDVYKRFQARVAKAEADSFNICEECGGYGTQYNDGWVRTLCGPDHDRLGKILEARRKAYFDKE